MPWRDDREEEKDRRCLRCLRMFLSPRCGIRSCPECTLRPPDVLSPPLVINMTDVEAADDDREAEDPYRW